MDKSTGKTFIVNGKEFTAETEFIAVVVFEELYVVRDIDGKKTEILVGSHRDINDKNQTVSIYTVPKTGDRIPIIPIAGVCMVSIIGIFLIIRRKIKLHIV